MPAHGRLGLVLVARLAGRYGSALDGDGRKTVWPGVEYRVRDSAVGAVAAPAEPGPEDAGMVPATDTVP